MGFRMEITIHKYDYLSMLAGGRRTLSPGAPIRVDQPDFELYTDASMQGYGVHFQGKSVGQRWSTADQNAYGDNINCLELKAVEYGLRSFGVELY